MSGPHSNKNNSIRGTEIVGSPPQSLVVDLGQLRADQLAGFRTIITNDAGASRVNGVRLLTHWLGTLQRVPEVLEPSRNDWIAALERPLPVTPSRGADFFRRAFSGNSPAFNTAYLSGRNSLETVSSRIDFISSLPFLMVALLNRELTQNFPAPLEVQFPSKLRTQCEIETCLRAAILARPADDLPRWVAADLLDETGIAALAAYAAFIRYQLYNRQSVLPARSGSQSDEVELSFARDWLGEVYGISDPHAADHLRMSSTFRRGVMCGLTISRLGMLDLLPEFAAREPITYLNINGVSLWSVKKYDAGSMNFPALRTLRISGAVDEFSSLLAADVTPNLDTIVFDSIGMFDGELAFAEIKNRTGATFALYLSDTNLDIGTSREAVEERLPIREVWTGKSVSCLPDHLHPYPFAASASTIEVLVADSDALTFFNADGWIHGVEEARRLKMIGCPSISAASLERLLDFDRFPRLEVIYAQIVEYQETRGPERVRRRTLSESEVRQIVHDSGRQISVRPFAEVPRRDVAVTE